MTEDQAYANTDKEIWRESDDFASPAIWTTDGGGIAVMVDSTVIVMTVRKWHEAAIKMMASWEAEEQR